MDQLRNTLHAALDKRNGQIETAPGSENESFFPLLGYHVGKLSGSEIPLITGLEDAEPSISDLKAFGAAFATTSSAPMFHIKGITPEAAETRELEDGLPCLEIERRELSDCWSQLSTASDNSVGLISLGSPHFSLHEFAQLAQLCSGCRKHAHVDVVVTTSRAVYEEALNAGHIDALEVFGARTITDTCWCMLGDPVIPAEGKNLMTDSGKYAHYAPGMEQQGVHFGSLSA